MVAQPFKAGFWRKAGLPSSLPEFWFHNLRHTSATLLLAEDCSRRASIPRSSRSGSATPRSASRSTPTRTSSRPCKPKPPASSTTCSRAAEGRNGRTGVVQCLAVLIPGARRHNESRGFVQKQGVETRR